MKQTRPKTFPVQGPNTLMTTPPKFAWLNGAKGRSEGTLDGSTVKDIVTCFAVR